MILVLATYTNMSKSPNLLLRFAYLAALLLPLINRIELLPSVLICTLSISYCTFAFPFMPTENIYYVVILGFFAIISFSKQKSKIRPLFILLLLFIFLNDLFFQQHVSRLTVNLLECILMCICIGNKQGSSNFHISLAFIMVSLVLSYWVLFVEEARINVTHSIEGMESLGWMDSNYLGGIIGVGCIIAVKELLQKRNNLLMSILCITTIIGSILSSAYLASRGAFLATGLGIIILILLSKTNKTTKTIITASIVIAIVVMYTTNVFDLLIARSTAGDTTGTGRTIIWERKLKSFIDEGSFINWIFGFGHDEGFLLGHFGKPKAFHNDFIAVLVEYGIVGVIMFVSILAYPIRQAGKQIRPTVIAFLVYLMFLGMTLEPLTGGNLVFLSFYFYITQIARYSKQIEIING